MDVAGDALALGRAPRVALGGRQLVLGRPQLGEQGGCAAALAHQAVDEQADHEREDDVADARDRVDAPRLQRPAVGRHQLEVPHDRRHDRDDRGAPVEQQEALRVEAKSGTSADWSIHVSRASTTIASAT